MTNIQEINEQLFDIFKKFGTDQLEDLLQVSLGYEYIQQVQDLLLNEHHGPILLDEVI